ncbi:hypothetical protein HPB47_016465 [Ixodes persulcatus]|uniref:Uncharacterized protein n=1 Tax=Ixodes persulcatus TaxID=34615 RepID=A0AC60QUH6_IXOPE|nr:hypothetical protein HPB47_016465 [Ixodes persulcatus]
MRPDFVLKVMIRQIWHRKGYPVEVFQAGFIRPVVGPLYAAIVGGPTVLLTDNQKLILAPGRPAVAWPQWLRMFETFLLASGASDFTPERRKALLLHNLGLEGQRIFFSLPPSLDASATVPPAAAAAKTTQDIGKTSQALSAYDQAVAVLTQHFASASNVAVESHRFCRHVRQPGESVLEYLAALRELATRCSFAALEDSLRDQFLEGIGSQHLRSAFF